MSSRVRAPRQIKKSNRQKVKEAVKDYGSSLTLAIGIWASLVGK